MAETYPWNYNKQFEAYITQFLRIFSGIQVRDGVKRENDSYKFRKVPVYYGPPTRITSEILNKRSSFPNVSLPLISGNLESISINTDRRGPTKYHEDKVSYKDSTGTYKTNQRLVGPALTLSLKVSIWASSNDELFQILEQLLLMFNPKVTIQKSTDIEDSNYITQVELTEISRNINTPLGTDSKTFQTDLQFSVDARMNYPFLVGEGGIIEKIITNVYDETNESDPVLLDSVETTESDL